MFVFGTSPSLSLEIVQTQAETSRWRVCYQRGLPRLVSAYVAPWILKRGSIRSLVKDESP